jgi:hypothetical protein
MKIVALSTNQVSGKYSSDVWYGLDDSANEIVDIDCAALDK